MLRLMPVKKKKKHKVHRDVRNKHHHQSNFEGRQQRHNKCHKQSMYGNHNNRKKTKNKKQSRKRISRHNKQQSRMDVLIKTNIVVIKERGSSGLNGFFLCLGGDFAPDFTGCACFCLGHFRFGLCLGWRDHAKAIIVVLIQLVE